ncbi:chemotaxis protein CheD [Tundrisphaera lichenicola]|uniref:chemotaxis protein CheD n=1 Tax=Tundrisphaera lichenicola TaxID=2029860 RepID=UPI003EB83734
MINTDKPGPPGELISVLMGRWAVASAPVGIRTLLGSCAGVVLYDRLARLGGVAHIVLPDSRGVTDHPGKYADTAIPALIADMERVAGRRLRTRITAKLFGGASMFQGGASIDIGRSNQLAVEQILSGLGVAVIARDMGGETGRRLTFSTVTGMVAVKIPGGADYEI